MSRPPREVGSRSAAGASLLRNHSQPIATPEVPVPVQREMDGAKRFFDDRGRGLSPTLRAC